MWPLSFKVARDLREIWAMKRGWRAFTSSFAMSAVVGLGWYEVARRVVVREREREREREFKILYYLFREISPRERERERERAVRL